MQRHFPYLKNPPPFRSLNKLTPLLPKHHQTRFLDQLSLSFALPRSILEVKRLKIKVNKYICRVTFDNSHASDAILSMKNSFEANFPILSQVLTRKKATLSLTSSPDIGFPWASSGSHEKFFHNRIVLLV